MLAFIFLLYIYFCAKLTAAVMLPVPPKVRTALAYLAGLVSLVINSDVVPVA
jgi:hypothetical protein